MQVARRRWSAVLIAGSAIAPKGTCVRQWLLQSRCQALGCGNSGHTIRIRAGTAVNTKFH